ncbi:MAG: hypothetical protein AAF363_17850 [Bacteroidota bacterium]
MAVTRLERKLKRRRIKAENRKNEIQALNTKPVIRDVDVQAIKEEFKKKLKSSTESKTSKAKKAVKKETVEAKSESVETKKEVAKKEVAPKESKIAKEAPKDEVKEADATDKK